MEEDNRMAEQDRLTGMMNHHAIKDVFLVDGCELNINDYAFEGVEDSLVHYLRDKLKLTEGNDFDPNKYVYLVVGFDGKKKRTITVVPRLKVCGPPGFTLMELVSFIENLYHGTMRWNSGHDVEEFYTEEPTVKVLYSDEVPEDEIHLVDSKTGNVLKKIINIGKE